MKSKRCILTKLVPMEFFKDGNFEAELSDFVHLLERLEDCDGIFNAMSIYNKESAEYLEKKKIIVKTVRRSYMVRNDNLRKKLLEEIYKLDGKT